jgi:hypothetical protein
MTHGRCACGFQVIIEITSDGLQWSPVHFLYKPGDVTTAPRWAAPHQPRLDWQMWFAALSTYHHNPWFVHLCVKLLQGSPAVLRLLDTGRTPYNAKSPPIAIRAHLYAYDFSATNSTDWWTRSYMCVPSITDRQNAVPMRQTS